MGDCLAERSIENNKLVVGSFQRTLFELADITDFEIPDDAAETIQTVQNAIDYIQSKN